MPHKCVKCRAVYEDGSAELLKGCSCGSRVFVFFKPEQEAEVKATDEDVKALEKELEPLTRDKTVSIQWGVENVRVREKGLYEIDVKSLMQGDPIVVKTDKEVYFVRFPAVKKRK
ncbi:MAG: Zn-ribbon containing protein [Candidatus Micrarchaeota archaeon]|nr:Zn-ribbon containing protein [Candidatus Micrarchaeota archaeon]